MNLFDHLNNISWQKQFDVINNEADMKNYNDFMINRYLSMDRECLFYSYLISKAQSLSKQTKYLFYLHMIPKRKRFFKYYKNDPSKLNIIQQYYKCDENEALQYLEVLSNSQVNKLEQILNTMKP